MIEIWIPCIMGFVSTIMCCFFWGNTTKQLAETSRSLNLANKEIARLRKQLAKLNWEEDDFTQDD
jgi:hypothetical protein